MSAPATTLSLGGIDLDHWQGLLDGLLDAAVIIDGELKPVIWNRAYSDAVGMRPRQIRAAAARGEIRCRDLLELEVCDSACLLKRCIRERRPTRLHEIRARVPRATQPARLVAVGAVPLRDAADEVVAVLEVYRDVTAEARVQQRYKALVEEQRQRAEKLEIEVQRRTEDLTRSLEELRATQERLIVSEKLSSVGRLAAGLAHELNNPLNFVSANVQFLKKHVSAYEELLTAYRSELRAHGEVPELAALEARLEFDYVRQDLPDVVEAMEVGTQRAGAILQELRIFLHGGATGDTRELDLAECVRSTVQLVKHNARHRVDIEVSFTEEPALVMGNRGQLGQVCMNLLVNALDAIDGRGRIEVRLRGTEDELYLEVQDDGCGIEDKDRLHVFDPFFTTKPLGHGTGLGLAVSHKVVASHGGRLFFDSELGEGTTFTMVLPRSTDAVDNPA